MSKKREETPLIQPRIRPLTKNQNLYWKAIDKSIITICAGPAGSGKSWIAVYKAIKLLQDNEIERVVITRPVKDAGESIGYIPGDILDKLHPYLLPLLDAFHEIVGSTLTNQWMEDGKLEILPLAFARGITRKNCLMILDEAQNASLSQLRMFLTRIGAGSKMIINGDPLQKDIRENDFKFVFDKLQDIEDITCVELTREDIVRHPLISKILERIGE